MLKPPLVDLDTAAAGEVIDPDDATRAQAILDTVSALVRNEAKQTWCDESGALTEVPDIAQVVTMQAWRRAWAVPIGVQAETVAVTSVTWDRDSRAGAYLTDDEKRTLRGLRPRTGGLRALRTTRRLDDALPDVSWPIVSTDGYPARTVYGDLDLMIVNGDA